MKYYRNFFSQSKINIETLMSRTSLFSCHMIIISSVIISCSKQFIIYPAFITWLNSSFILYSHYKIFIEIFSYYAFIIIRLFKNCFNKFIDFIFSSLRNNWLAKFIINTYNFVSKTAKSMFLIFFSI